MSDEILLTQILSSDSVVTSFKCVWIHSTIAVQTKPRQSSGKPCSTL